MFYTYINQLHPPLLVLPSWKTEKRQMNKLSDVIIIILISRDDWWHLVSIYEANHRWELQESCAFRLLQWTMNHVYSTSAYMQGVQKSGPLFKMSVTPTKMAQWIKSRWVLEKFTKLSFQGALKLCHFDPWDLREMGLKFLTCPLKSWQKYSG